MRDEVPDRVGRMDEWWQGEMTRKGEPQLVDYYRLLEGCDWRVWRVRGEHAEEAYMRVMQRVDGGNERISLALQYSVVIDRADE